MSLHIPENAPATAITVTSGRSISGGSLVVANWPASWTGFPKILVIRRLGAIITVLEATSISTATLAISGAIDGYADAAQLVGDTVTVEPTALAITELQTLIGASISASPYAVPVEASYGSPEKIAIATVAYDTASWWDGTNHRYTPQLAGYYRVDYSLQMQVVASAGDNFVDLGFAVNGTLSPFWTYRAVPGTSGWGAQLCGTGLVYMNGSTDYVELFAGFGNVSLSGTRSCNLAMTITFEGR